MILIAYALLSVFCDASTPKTNAELRSAIVECLKDSTDCSKGPYGPIGSWDVSSMIDMHGLFAGAKFFHADLSKWDVSSVTNMGEMFGKAAAFNADIENWDVSSV